MIQEIATIANFFCVYISKLAAINLSYPNDRGLIEVGREQLNVDGS